LRRHGGIGANVAGILVLVIVVAVGAMMYGGQQLQSKEGSGSGGGGPLSDAFSFMKNGLSFASGGGLAQVQTATVGLIADTFTGDAPISPTCGVAPRNSYIQVVNTGSATGNVKGVTITYGGAVNRFSISGPCAVGSSGSPTATMYILFKGPSKLADSTVAQPGLPFTGEVTLDDGANLPFAGSFFQGYPKVMVEGVRLAAADFVKGLPTNSTCGADVSGHSYIRLNNSGTVGTTATAVTISTKNGTSTIPIAGSCHLGVDGTTSAVTYILFGQDENVNFTAVAGQAYTGSVVLSSKQRVSFDGTFQ
jgi:hypothetical protein